MGHDLCRTCIVANLKGVRVGCGWSGSRGLMYYEIRAIMMARLILPTIHRVTPHTHTPHFIHSTRVTRPPSYVLLGTKLPGFLPRGRRVKQCVGSQGEILGTVYDHTAGRRAPHSFPFPTGPQVDSCGVVLCFRWCWNAELSSR